MKRKFLRKIFSIISTLAALSSCGLNEPTTFETENSKLETPTGVRYDLTENKARWEAIDKADYYKVKIDELNLIPDTSKLSNS